MRIDIFAKARPRSIYKQDYLNELLKLFDDESLVMTTAPPRSEWCLKNSDNEDAANERHMKRRGLKRPQNDIYEQSNKEGRKEIEV